MDVFDYFLVFVIGAFAGGWTIPVGVQLGLDAIGVYVMTSLGAIVGSIGFLTVFGRWRDRIFDRYYPDAEERVAGSRAGAIVDRWGIPGLAIAGTTVIGPTIAQLAVLVLGVDRKRFLVWFGIATVVLYAALTVFWVAVLR